MAEPTGGRTLKVTWHPNAITGAVERAAAITGSTSPDDSCQVPWMDLACLLDLARHALAEERETEQQRDLALWLHAEARWEHTQALLETTRVENAWREVVKQWEQGHQNDVLPYTAELEGEIAALKAEAAEVVPVLDTLARVLAGDPRDWSLDRRDAWLWGVLCGWDCDDHPAAQECDETCTNALASVAERHGWNDVEMDVLRKMRATIREARRG